MNRILKRLPWIDFGIFSVLVVGYTVWLLATVQDLGYARDEGFYFQAADAYLEWFRLLAADADTALKRATV
ncbi:MAG: hypothetical protein RJA70_1247, partial [Pseudomonadota bacterium]